MSKARRYLAVLVACVAALTVAACGASSDEEPSGGSSSGGAAKQDVKVAFFNGLQGNAYGQAELEAAKEAAAKAGVELTEFGVPFDSNAQIAQIQDAITSGKFDAFVVLPVDGNALVPVVQQAVDADIKVVATFNTVSRDIGSIEPGVPGMTAMVGEPMAENGRNIGESIVGACEGKSPCNVVYLPGTFKQATEQIRTEALHEFLEGHPDIKIVAEQEGGYLQDPALKVTTDILRANDDIDVIATSGDQMTLGAEQAVKNADLTGEIVLVGSAASEQGVQAVREGRWYATAVYLPRTEARLATEYAIKAARGEEVPKSTNTLPLSPVGSIVTEESLSTPEGKKFKGEWRA